MPPVAAIYSSSIRSNLALFVSNGRTMTSLPDACSSVALPTPHVAPLPVIGISVPVWLLTMLVPPPDESSWEPCR